MSDSDNLERAAVRKDKKKLSAEEIFDILDSGDLSEIEDLCDDENATPVNNENEDEEGPVLDGTTPVLRAISNNVVEAAIDTSCLSRMSLRSQAGKTDNNRIQDDDNIDEEEIVLEDGTPATCQSLKDFQQEYFKDMKITEKKHVEWLRGGYNPSVPVFQEYEEQLYQASLNPMDIFYKYISQEMIVQMVECTNYYAVSKNVANFNPTKIEEMKVFLGIHLAMGNLGYPRVRMYWEPRFQIPIISESGITVNRFFKMRTCFHVVKEDQKPDNNEDRFWKIRPLYNNIRKRCNELPVESKMSIDEQMVPFKGSLDVKQYIRNKPTKWGVKIFVLCGESGTMLDFLIYQGSTTEVKPEFSQFGLGAAVVMQLSDRLPPFCQLYFDNFFSTYPLFQWLKKKEIYAVGTIRVDRFGKPPLKSDQEMKKLPRGSVDEVVSQDKIILTKWADNSCVTLGSNFVGEGVSDTCRRWDKKQKKYIDVPRPQCVQFYNASMGGVDKLDFLVALYRTFIRSKKWTLRMFTHALDLAVTNSWLEYRKESARQHLPAKEVMDLIHFRQYVAEVLIVGGRQPPKKRGRPSSAEEATAAPIHPKRVATIKPVMDVRYDGMHHLPEVSSKTSQDRCKNEGCTGKTFIICSKCKIFLCLSKQRNCFAQFHTR